MGTGCGRPAVAHGRSARDSAMFISNLRERDQSHHVRAGPGSVPSRLPRWFLNAGSGYNTHFGWLYGKKTETLHSFKIQDCPRKAVEILQNLEDPSSFPVGDGLQQSVVWALQSVILTCYNQHSSWSSHVFVPMSS